MNLLGNLFIFIFIYTFIFGTYVCRISNERRCVNADCSEPISFAHTLIRYIADDRRHLSFKQNAKAKIFSKEAGDVPQFWEAEINGRRGYVPKNFLREDKVLVKSKDVKVIVPTGRDSTPKHNDTVKSTAKTNPEPVLSKTPELSVVNSKGFFSTIGGVSADSVPPNPPDIRPHSTKKFQVFDKTTIYDDSVIISEENSGKQIQTVEETPSVLSSEEVKTEETKISDKNVPESKQLIETEQISKSESNDLNDKSKEHVEMVKRSSDNVGGSQSEIDILESGRSSSESSTLNSWVKSMSNLISSGTGPNEKQEEENENDENSEYDDEEDYEEEESDLQEKVAEVASSVTNKEVTSDIKPSELEEKLVFSDNESSVDHSQNDVENVSIAPNLENILDQNLSLNLNISSAILGTNQSPDEDLSNTNNSTNHGNIQLSKETQEVVHESNVETDSSIQSILKDSSSTSSIDNLSEKTAEVSKEPSKILLPQPLKEINTASEENSKETISDVPNNDSVNVQEQLKPDLTEIPPKTVSESNDKEELSSDPTNTTSTNVIPTDKLIVSDQTPDLEFKSEDAAKIPVLNTEQNNEVKLVNEVPKAPFEEPPETKQMTNREFLFAHKRIQEKRHEEDKQANTETVHELSSPDIVTTLKPNTIEDTSTPTSLDAATVNQSYQQLTEEHISSTNETDQIVSTEGSEEILEDDKGSIMLTETVISEDVENLKETSKEDSVDKMLDISPQETITSDNSEFVPADKQIVEDYVTGTLTDDSESFQDTSSSVSTEIVPPDEKIIEAVSTETMTEESSEGMFSFLNIFMGLFGSSETSEIASSDGKQESESLDPTSTSYIKDESCSVEGVGEEACDAIKGVPISKDVTWQESLYSTDMSATLDLLNNIPLETTVWLIVTAVVVLIFSLGHYYIEAHRRDGPLVAKINKLEREVLILKKETCIMEDRLQTTQEELEVWNTNSSENDALIVELKQELEETKIAKMELEEQLAVLEKEVETVTESGLEMHRLLEESLSSQDGSQVLLSTVQTLREKLDYQENEIAGLSQKLSHKNAEVDDLQEKLSHAAELTRGLEDRIVVITRVKEEEALILKDNHRMIMAQLEELMETKALDETRVSTEMSKLRLSIEELQKTLAEKESELEAVKEVVKQLRSTDSNDKMDALFDVVGMTARLNSAVAERDELKEKFQEEEGARKLLEGHMKKITTEVTELKNSFERAEKEKIEALTKLQVLSNYFKEKESQLQKELGMQESMWLQKQSDDHTIYEQMRSLREENDKYKLQNESLKKEIVEQESSFKIQLANVEQKAHENWVASRQAERRLKEAQQESAQLRNRLTSNSANFSLDDGKQNISESNGDPSSPPPSMMFPPTASSPYMMYPPPGDFVPPPPLMGSPYPSDSRPPPLGRISSPPLDHRFSPPPPLPYPPYDYPPYGHHSPSPPLPPHSHHRTVHKPQPRDMSREQKDHVMSNYSPEADKTKRRNKR